MSEPASPLVRSARVRLAAAVAAAVVVLVVGFALIGDGNGGGRPARSPGAAHGSAGPINRSIEGLTTFRGNASRSNYGRGPVPSRPEIRWQTPKQPMCMISYIGPDPKTWCGTGWTGQPNVVVNDDGTIEVREGAYDGAYHFLDGLTGLPVRPPLQTLDLAKGSATSDPDGYPLYYGGSRDNYFRVMALDRPEPQVLWQISADTSVPKPLRNNDWDGSALVIGDVLFEGGENGWLYVVRLNRGYNAAGLVTVDPEILATIPGFDDKLLSDIGDKEVSIEGSVAFRGGVVWFANSGGLVQGWDVSAVIAGTGAAHRVFRFWAGDDIDASLVLDDEGFVYAAAEHQRGTDRSREVGQLMKLDPRHPDEPLVWSIHATETGFEGAGGSWSTPALDGPDVYFTTAAGRLLQVDRASGQILWEGKVGAPAISSPVVVEGVLIQGDCSGHLRAWDVSDPGADPAALWDLQVPGCIESTPAVWDGWIYVGTRDGYLFGISDPVE
jgi:outer membrane protein assembly factor BamB